MIDTLKIFTQDFKLTDQNILTLRTDLNRQTGETRQKYFYNSEVFNLSIDNRGLFMQFSLPKFYGTKSNVYSVGANGCQVALNKIEPVLKDVGIETSLNNFKISRLDMFKNVETSRPFFDYSLIFDFLTLKRTQKRDYGTTYTVFNSMRELCFYDKNQESLLTSGHKIEGLENNNILRGELRLKQHREVREKGFDYVKDLPNQWDIVKAVYYKQLENFFSFEFKDSEAMKEKEMLTALFREYGKRAFVYVGFDRFRTFKDSELRELFFSKYSRRTAFRYLNEYRQGLKNYMDFLDSKVNFKSLYLELKEKFSEGLNELERV